MRRNFSLFYSNVLLQTYVYTSKLFCLESCEQPSIDDTFGMGSIWGSHGYHLAWDGDVLTYADADGTGFATGVSLTEPAAINSFQFYPRTDNDANGRLIGAKFQGADSVSGPWEDLATIGQYPAGSPQYRKVEVSSDVAYSHYRIYFPESLSDYGSIAEVVLCISAGIINWQCFTVLEQKTKENFFKGGRLVFLMMRI